MLLTCARGLILIALLSSGGGCGARSAVARLDKDVGVPLDAMALLGARGVVLPPGTFMMGSPDGDPCKLHLEPYTRVTLTRAFEIQTTEVTWAELESLGGSAPQPACKDCPAFVSWYEAAAHANALSDQHGLPRCYTCKPALLTPTECSTAAGLSTILDCQGFRLPTEAEWEYASRAGTTTPFYLGDGRDCHEQVDVLATIAWFAGNSQNRLHRVGGKIPNGWGLYDTLGNMYEMAYASVPIGRPYPESAVDPVNDRAGLREWVIRGGMYQHPPQMTRSADRGSMTFLSIAGFRVVRTVDE